MKNAGLILVVAFIIYGVLRLLNRKISNMGVIEKALQKVKNTYGTAIAENVEKIYRLETNHFQSQQFKETFSAGMEAHGKTYPYGWVINDFWNKPEGLKYRPIGTHTMQENIGLSGKGGAIKTFLKFPTIEAAMMTLAEFLYIYGNNAGRWYSLDTNKQTAYNKRLDQINVLFT